MGASGVKSASPKAIKVMSEDDFTFTREIFSTVGNVRTSSS